MNNLENISKTESEIIQACQTGHMESFVLLYDRYAEKIFKFVYFRTFHKQHAEDVTSQVFMRAMEKIGSYNQAKGTFQSWLYQIARNLIIDEFRKSKPTENLDAHYNLQDNTDLNAEVENKMAFEQLAKLIAELPQESQELITMRLWDELSYSEIAFVTGKTEGSLKMQFSRIVNKLQTQVTTLLLLIIYFNY